MSKYHSNKWFVETLRYLLQPDTEIVDDDGAVIIYCKEIGWEIKSGSVVRRKTKWTPEELRLSLGDRRTQVCPSRSGLLCVDIPNATIGDGSKGNSPMALRLFFYKQRKELTSVLQINYEKSMVLGVVDFWTWVNFGMKIEKRSVRRLTASATPSWLMKEMGVVGERAVVVAQAQIYSSPEKVWGTPIMTIPVYFALLNPENDFPEPIWEMPTISTANLFAIARERTKTAWRLAHLEPSTEG